MEQNLSEAFTLSCDFVGWSACWAKLQLRPCHGQGKAPNSVWLPYQVSLLPSFAAQTVQTGCTITDESKQMTIFNKRNACVSIYMRLDKLCAKHPPSSRPVMSPDYLSTTFVSNAQFCAFSSIFVRMVVYSMNCSWLHRFCISKWRFYVHEGRRAKTGFARWGSMTFHT